MAAHPEGRSGWLRRLVWFAGLWLTGVLAVTALAYALRLLIIPG